MASSDAKELEAWDARIRERVAEFGLDCYPQEFEICDHNQMLGYMAYSGMPSHYPHWSYGKSFEKLKTLYDYGVSGLPYEMVINSNPALAYLMRDNSLLLNILTIAHVYGHNDFFKNNFTFRSTRAEYTIVQLQGSRHACSALHGGSRHRRRQGRGGPRRRPRALPAMPAQPGHPQGHARRGAAGGPRRRATAARTPSRTSTAAPSKWSPIYGRFRLIPDEDLLLFVRDHNPFLAEWEKDLLTIVHEEAQYFIPQIETKIMNEGWASYWHKQILDSLELPADLGIEFLVRHNQVVRPHEGGINPYHLGLRIWEDLRRRYDEAPPPARSGRRSPQTAPKCSSRSGRPTATRPSCAAT